MAVERDFVEGVVDINSERTSKILTRLTIVELAKNWSGEIALEYLEDLQEAGGDRVRINELRHDIAASADLVRDHQSNFPDEVRLTARAHEWSFLSDDQVMQKFEAEWDKVNSPLIQSTRW